MSEPAAYLVLEIGHAGRLRKKELRKAIENTKMVIANTSPLTAIDVAIGGYDDDPRELWEILEARKFIIDYARGLMEAGVAPDRFLATTLQLFGTCLAVEQGQQITATDEPVDITDQLREYQARARKNVQ